MALLTVKKTPSAGLATGQKVEQGGKPKNPPAQNQEKPVQQSHDWPTQIKTLVESTPVPEPQQEPCPADAKHSEKRREVRE